MPREHVPVQVRRAPRCRRRARVTPQRWARARRRGWAPRRGTPHVSRGATARPSPLARSSLVAPHLRRASSRSPPVSISRQIIVPASPNLGRPARPSPSSARDTSSTERATSEPRASRQRRRRFLGVLRQRDGEASVAALGDVAADVIGEDAHAAARRLVRRWPAPRPPSRASDCFPRAVCSPHIVPGDVPGDGAHGYWSAHVDKANVPEYDVSAVLYLSDGDGAHFREASSGSSTGTGTRTGTRTRTGTGMGTGTGRRS